MTMTMTQPASTPAPAKAASFDQILRVVIALVGVIEGLSGLTDLPVLFGDITKIPGTSPGGLAILASSVLHPILGFAALAFALTRRLRHGIVALGAFALAKWFSDALSMTANDLQLNGDAFVNSMMLFQIVIQPVVAAGAIAAAWFNRHLVAATIAVMLPTLVNAAGIAAFAIGVSLHGF
jgi:hypothetical protein